MRRRQGSRAVTSLTYTVVFSSLLLTLISQINVASVAASETQATNFPDPRGTQSLMYLSFITSIASIYVSVDHLIRSGLSLAVVHIFVDWLFLYWPCVSSACCVSDCAWDPTLKSRDQRTRTDVLTVSVGLWRRASFRWCVLCNASILVLRTCVHLAKRGFVFSQAQKIV